MPDARADATVTTPAVLVRTYAHVIVIATVGAVAVLLWIGAYEAMHRLFWENDLVSTTPWLFPVICMPFSLVVGLLVKYRRAPTNLDESLMDSLAGDTGKIDWRLLPVNILTAWASLLSGAVIGPEGGIGGIGSRLAILYSDKLHVSAADRPRLVFSTLASAYNGLIASPLFTGVVATELIKDPDARGRTLPANLIGGAIGYVIFAGAGMTGLQDYLHLEASGPLVLSDLVLVVGFGLLGMLLAMVAGIMFRVAAAFFGRLEGREVERALLGGAIFSVVGVAAPILMFAGEDEVLEVVADPGAYGPLILAGMAFAKLALLSVAFKSGFLGGPVFPSIFASTCVALAIGLVLPAIPIAVIIGGVMAGFLTVLFRAPFMVILLTAIMLGSDMDLTALIVLAVAAVLVVQPFVLAGLEAVRERRATGGVPQGAGDG